MNTIIYKISPAGDKQTVNTICSFVHARDFHSAELTLLELIEDMMNREYNTSDERDVALKSVKAVYRTFNDYYSNWLEENKLNVGKEMNELKANIHPNILFAHCTDPESMDDLMYEISNYLTHYDSDEQYDEAQYHLSCYRSTVHT